MAPATVSPIIPTTRAPRTRKPKAPAVPPSDQTTPPLAAQGQTPPGSMDAPTVPSNSGTLDAEAQARAEALAAATARAVVARTALPLALASIDSSEQDKRDAFVQVFEYFDRDKGFAWRNLDGFATMDAAIAHHYKVPEGDTAALKSARDVNTYRRRLGAKFSGLLLMGATTPAPDAPDKASKAPSSDAALVGKYLKSKWGKLSLAEQELILKDYTAQWLLRLRAEQPDRAAKMDAAPLRTGTDG
jgi:hypothetical protein